MKKLGLKNLPDGLWVEMRYCLEEEISWFKPDDSGDLAQYPELTMEQIPLFQFMIAFEHRREGSLRYILGRYKHWLDDMLSNYYDEGQYAPEADGAPEAENAEFTPNEWVGRLERLRDRLP